MLKATVDQRISMQKWRIPWEKISINTLNETPEEATGVYAKEDCSIPAGTGNASQYRQVVRLQGKF